jgi:hypothetical protein
VTQEWSRQLMIHAKARDGIGYHSRKNPRKHNYAIYDTTLTKASLRVLERTFWANLFPSIDVQ